MALLLLCRSYRIRAYAPPTPTRSTHLDQLRPASPPPPLALCPSTKIAPSTPLRLSTTSSPCCPPPCRPPSNQRPASPSVLGTRGPAQRITALYNGCAPFTTSTRLPAPPAPQPAAIAASDPTATQAETRSVRGPGHHAHSLYPRIASKRARRRRRQRASSEASTSLHSAHRPLQFALLSADKCRQDHPHPHPLHLVSRLPLPGQLPQQGPPHRRPRAQLPAPNLPVPVDLAGPRALPAPA